jgi:hypothetical protein
MRLRETCGALVIALLLCGTAAFAQDQKQDEPASPLDPNAPLQPLDANPAPGYPNRPPIGAARGVNGPDQTQPYDPAQVVPDHNTLAGAAPFTLGSMQHNRNILDPSISLSQLGETIPNTTGTTTLAGISVASGSLNFNRVWSEYNFAVLYNGGETFNEGFGGVAPAAGITSPHYQFHNLMITQEANWARWHILLRDTFAASPGATFTGQGMGGPGLVAQNSALLGSSLNGLGQAFIPSETVNTGNEMRYENSVLGQAEYSFSRRSAFTFAGSYGLLHFTGTGYVSSSMINGQAGYDYLLDPANSIAILASYGKIEYTGTSISTTDYMGALAYGRKITGRLAFQVSAGPQRIISSGLSGLGNTQLWFASVNSALTYERRRGGVSFGYLRGLTEGSGVFQGATGNTFSGGAHYQFTRFWSITSNGGYSLNDSLPVAGVATARFDNWFIGGNLGRRVGLHTQLNFNYGLTKQNSPTPCPVVSCGIAGYEQTFGMSVNWHLRPAGL